MVLPLSPFRRSTRRQTLFAAFAALSGLQIAAGAAPARGARSASETPTPDPTPSSTLLLYPRTALHRFVSRLLGRTMPYFVYRPPGYDNSADARYPVLYMLHGLGGSNTEWVTYGLLAEADRLMRRGEVPPYLIVLPQGDRGYWVDHASGGPAWGTYTAREVVAEIDGGWRTRADPAYRAIGGDSMGAHGALQLALNFPGTFGVVGAHTPVFRTYAEAPLYFGSPRDFAARNPVTLIRARVEAARRLAIWIDIGAEDRWFAKALMFHEELLALHVQHEWHVYPGGHSGLYWSAHVEAYLHFYGSTWGRS